MYINPFYPVNAYLLIDSFISYANLYLTIARLVLMLQAKIPLNFRFTWKHGALLKHLQHSNEASFPRLLIRSIVENGRPQKGYPFVLSDVTQSLLGL